MKNIQTDIPVRPASLPRADGKGSAAKFDGSDVQPFKHDREPIYRARNALHHHVGSAKQTQLRANTGCDDAAICPGIDKHSQ